MSTSDEQLKRAADLKLWLESRISELQEELEKLKEAQTMVDGLLRASSFRPASEVMPTVPAPRTREAQTPAAEEETPSGGEIPEIRELRKDRGGETIAVAQITREHVVIEPVAEVSLRADTPPFKSFLIGKILTGMKTKDEELAAKGRLPKGGELRFTVGEKGGKIASLTIENYRENERLTEILNTVGWTFSRMLEKSAAAATSSR